MKRRIAALSVALLAASAAVGFAQAPPAGPPPGQGQGPPGGGANRRMAALLEGITLTAPQQGKFDSIQTAYRALMPAFTPGSPPDSAARARSMELRGKREADLRTVLTAEQQAIWDRNMANMPAGPPRRPS